jgi:hypothetical protein
MMKQSMLSDDNSISTLSISATILTFDDNERQDERTTSYQIYVRFHGKNRENWFKRNITAAERLKYLYYPVARQRALVDLTA